MREIKTLSLCVWFFTLSPYLVFLTSEKYKVQEGKERKRLSEFSQRRSMIAKSKSKQKVEQQLCVCVCVYITPSQLFCDEQMSIYEKTSGHQLVGKQSRVLMSSTPVKKKALLRFCSAQLGTNIHVINSYYCTLRYRSRRLYTVRAKVLSYTSFLYILHPSSKTLFFRWFQ